MSVGDTIYHWNNVRTWANTSCQQLGQEGFPFITQLEAYWPSYDTGSNLGVRDVILVKYIPNPCDTYFERFYYVSGAGWAGWENWQNGSMISQNLFETFGGANTQPISPCATPPTS